MSLSTHSAPELNSLRNPEHEEQAPIDIPFSSKEVHFFVDTYPEGIVLLTPVYDSSGTVIDFVYSYINRTAEVMLQRSKRELIGRQMLEVFPGTDIDGIFNIYVKVLVTGTTATVQFHYPHEGFDTWFRQRIEKFEDGILVHTSDIGQTNEPLKASMISEG